MRLESEQGEVTRHRAFGNASVLGRTAHAPLGRVRRSAVEHLAHQRRHLLVVVTARTSRTQFPMQPRYPAFTPAAPPMADGRNELTRSARQWSDWRSPSADISTIRARRTSECGKLRIRAIAPNCVTLLAALTVTTVLGLPIGQYPTTSVSEIK